ncbi:cubilin-like [Pollicipes pollicipes]|uniref:cubilin-like n=1 Tax=Pollicipes pollicipes TaxID=41117 RepID=UPI001884EEE7|nr:cubilin-like [Pollicipes pollicipes]
MWTRCLLLVTAAAVVAAELTLEEELAKAQRGAPARHRVRRDACGGAFTHETEDKVITSPNYPNDYHNSAQCYYTIKVPQGHRIHVTFEDFRIEIPRTSSSNCTYDGLVVRDGSQTVEPMGRYCGKVKPPNFESRSNYLVMNLYSDESLGFRGFKLRYTVHCGQTFFSDHGTLLFKENDQHISGTNTCDYELTTTPGKFLDLNFTINELILTTVQVFDHGELIRTLRKGYDYKDMDVRVISTSNVVRVRFTYAGLAEGHVVIAYQTHNRAVVSGDRIFLFHLQTCRGLATSAGQVTASDVTKSAVAHRLEKVGGHQNDSLIPGDEVYLRTQGGGSRPLSVSATENGLAGYDETARDNSTWRLYGQLRHGGRVWLENKRMIGNYLGMYGAVSGPTNKPTVTATVALCQPPVDWIMYRVPLDFGWYRYESSHAFEARWVDGVAAAAYRDCLAHPLLFPHCGGTHELQCDSGGF